MNSVAGALTNAWEAVRSAPPTVWIAAAAALAGVAIVVVSAAALRRLRRRGVRPGAARSRPSIDPVTVLHLGARGAPRAEIARVTGLSQDAVSMLLSANGEMPARQIRPPAA